MTLVVLKSSVDLRKNTKKNAKAHGELQNKPTIFPSLTFRGSAAGSLYAGLRFAP